MATVRDVLNPELFCVQAGETVYEAARQMSQRNIGAVPVLRDGKLAGIFSERDMMRRVVAEQRDPQKVLVSEVMTSDPCTVRPEEDIEHCMLLMKQNSFRHLPVCDGEKLVGFLSMRDLLLHDLDEKEIEVRMMRAYISSDVA